MRGSDNGFQVKQPFGIKTAERHLFGDQPIGVYPLMDSKHTVWACVDIDFDSLSLAYEVVEWLAEHDIYGHVEISRSKGWHVWVFYDAWVPALWQRWVYPLCVDELGFPKLECNPKSPTGEKYGNYVRLPYPAKHVETRRQVVLGDGELLPFGEFLFSAKVTSWKSLRKAAFRSPLMPELKETRSVLGSPMSGQGGKWKSQVSAQYLLNPSAVIPVGQRDETFFTLARLLRGRNITEGEALSVLEKIHSNQTEDPSSYSFSAVRAKVRTAWK